MTVKRPTPKEDGQMDFVFEVFDKLWGSIRSRVHSGCVKFVSNFRANCEQTYVSLLWLTGGRSPYQLHLNVSAILTKRPLMWCDGRYVYGKFEPTCAGLFWQSRASMVMLMWGAVCARGTFRNRLMGTFAQSRPLLTSIIHFLLMFCLCLHCHGSFALCGKCFVTVSRWVLECPLVATTATTNLCRTSNSPHWVLLLSVHENLLCLSLDHKHVFRVDVRQLCEPPWNGKILTQARGVMRLTLPIIRNRHRVIVLSSAWTSEVDTSLPEFHAETKLKFYQL